MNYLLLFLGGIATFISPCLLPMLPVYFIYLAGSATGEDANDANNGSSGSIKRKNRLLINAFGFVLSFSIIFITFGALAGTYGRFMIKYSNIVNWVSGIIVILIGLNYINIIRLPLINRSYEINYKKKNNSFFSAVLMGLVFSVGWTPCVSQLLGVALLMAANAQSAVTGITMLIVYCLGLGVPFILSAVLLDSASKVFDTIKKHYKVINTVSGVFLILIGILMISGKFGWLMSLFL